MFPAIKLRDFLLKPLCFAFLFLQIFCSFGDTTGYFWQITDFHFEPDYLVGSDPGTGCISGNGSAAQFGDYNCDVPRVLLDSALDFMNSTHSDVDFLLWTGDIVPHDSKWAHWGPVALGSMIFDITSWIRASFPGKTLYPILGNHDAIPCHTIEPGPNWLLDMVYEIWKDLIPSEESDSFKKGGYYSLVIPNTKIRLLFVNTVFYYELNKATENMTDPGGQLKWIDDTLKIAKGKGEYVWVIGHIPPSMQEWGGPNMWDNFNDEFISAFKGYGDIIKCHIYGHEHSDTFRIQNMGNDVVVPYFVTGSLDEWGQKNPQLRLFKYDKSSGIILSYNQYIADLDSCNKQGYIKWELEYEPCSAFGIKDLSGNGMKELYNSLSQNDDAFQMYYKFNSGSRVPGPCSGHCKLLQLCAMRYLTVDEYKKCIQS